MKIAAVLMAAGLCLCSCSPPAPPPAPSPPTGDAELTAFAIAQPCCTGAIDQGTRSIHVEVPAGTDVTGLVAVFESTGVSVSVAGVEQSSGVTRNDFTAPLEYAVMAEDGSSATYMASVTPAAPPSTEKSITEFSVARPAVSGIIDAPQRAISVTVPHGTDVTSLVAVFITTGILVTVDDTEQESGVTVNDFTDPRAFVVTAEDGSTATWLVTAIEEPSSEKALTAFTLQAPGAVSVLDPDARMIRVRVSEGTNLTALVAVFETTGVDVSVGAVTQISGITANNFTLTVPYLVTAEDGTSLTWTVRVNARMGLMINELDVDQVGTDTAEFVELYADSEVDTEGLALVFLNGGALPGVEYARMSLGAAGILPAGSFLVVAAPGVPVDPAAVKLMPPGWELSNRIQNGPRDAVMLFDTIARRIVDTVSYNGVLHNAILSGEQVERDATEGSVGAPSDSNTVTGSIGRIPSGCDTGQNGADFRFCPTLTPGAPNQ
jgi:hypothetical protein